MRYEESYETEEEYEAALRRRERQKRRARELRRRRRRRQLMIRRIIAALIALLVLAGLIFGVVRLVKWIGASRSDKIEQEIPVAESITDLSEEADPETIESEMADAESIEMEADAAETEVVQEPEQSESPSAADRAAACEKLGIAVGYDIAFTDQTQYIGLETVNSPYAVLVDLKSNQAIYHKDGKSRIVPASMTKIMTLLVACEHLNDLSMPVTVTIEDTDFAYRNDCSAAGFAQDETVTVEDLLYGTILPSGGDAAHALARTVAGSHEAFVDMMNDKLRELGISDTTHFTNCVGIYNDNHYSTPRDMAVILKAALELDACREVLGARIYTTSSTSQHPNGIELSNWFIRRIEDKDCGGTVMGAKTGFVVQSANCAASWFISNSGNPYICVTVGAHSHWRAIYDHVDIYHQYTR